MESVDVMAGADAATSGRPLIDVIDVGQVDLSSDGIESFEDSSSSSTLTPFFKDPPFCRKLLLQTVAKVLETLYRILA